MPETYAILTRETPSLRERSVEVEVSDITTPDFQAFLDKLTQTMEIEDGIGIAAPQVGINKRVVIVKLSKGREALINPEIIKTSEAAIETEEGCLNVPGVYGMVTRFKRIRIKALDRTGRRIERDLKNMDAVVTQHEIDHLDGVLFIDKVNRITKGTNHQSSLLSFRP